MLPRKRLKSSAAKAPLTPKGSLPVENPQKAVLEARLKNRLTVPTRDMIENHQRGETGRAIYDLVSKLDLENASSSSIYALLGNKLPSLPFVADFQAEARDAIQGAMSALVEKRRLPRPEILRHVFAALIFFARKEIVPISAASQAVAQEALYAKWHPQFMAEFSMRTTAHTLGQAVSVLQLSGSLGRNLHYTHTAKNMEAVLRGLGEGIKSASLLMTGEISQAMANLRKFQQGIEDGYEEVRKEYYTRTAAGMLGKLLPKTGPQ